LRRAWLAVLATPKRDANGSNDREQAKPTEFAVALEQGNRVAHQIAGSEQLILNFFAIAPPDLGFFTGSREKAAGHGHRWIGSRR
jgi:hypothetical protein